MRAKMDDDEICGAGPKGFRAAKLELTSISKAPVAQDAPHD